MGNRFVVTLNELTVGVGQAKILLDRKTGINYLLTYSANGQAITPLLGPNGMPTRTTMETNQPH